MRRGIATTCLPPSRAGARRYVLGIIRGRARLDHDQECYVSVKVQDVPLFANLPTNMHRVELSNYPRPLRLIWQPRGAGVCARCRLEIWPGTHYTLPRSQSGLRLVSTFHDMGVFIRPEFYSAVEQLLAFLRKSASRKSRSHFAFCKSHAFSNSKSRKSAGGCRGRIANPGVCGFVCRYSGTR